MSRVFRLDELIGCNSNQLKDIMLFCGYEEINLNLEKKLYFFKQKN